MGYEVYERFVGRRPKSAEEPMMISIPKSAHCVFLNRATINMVQERFPGHRFRFLFDRESSKIALQITNDDPHAYMIRTSQGRAHHLSASGFLKYIGYNGGAGTRRFPLVWNEELHGLEFEIDRKFLTARG